MKVWYIVTGIVVLLLVLGFWPFWLTQKPLPTVPDTTELVRQLNLSIASKTTQTKVAQLEANKQAARAKAAEQALAIANAQAVNLSKQIATMQKEVASVPDSALRGRIRAALVRLADSSALGRP